MFSQDFLIGYACIASREHITPTPASMQISTPPGSMPVFLCLDVAGRLAIAAIAGVDNSIEHKSIVADMLSDWKG